MNDTGPLQRYAAGEEGAFQELVGEYQDSVYAFLRRETIKRFRAAAGPTQRIPFGIPMATPKQGKDGSHDYE
jgi:hypothetical protein